jgi:hypothetical protein
MMTVPSPLMGKKLAKLAYLLVVPNSVDSPLPNGVSLENDACAREVTGAMRPRAGHFAARAGRKSERFCHDMALPCGNDVSADELR